MIRGTVLRRRGTVDLLVKGPLGQGDVEFVVDTGFTGFITLPPAACQTLGLRLDRLQPSTLADGSQVLLDVYEATVLWDGALRQVEALALAGAPLGGMTMADGYEVCVQSVDGGTVTIQRLP